MDSLPYSYRIAHITDLRERLLEKYKILCLIYLLEKIECLVHVPILFLVITSTLGLTGTGQYNKNYSVFVCQIKVNRLSKNFYIYWVFLFLKYFDLVASAFICQMKHFKDVLNYLQLIFIVYIINHSLVLMGFIEITI